ncbi:MAG TPA: hypothetical protein VF066_17995 [Thermoleophilaceae bacterium]
MEASSVPGEERHSFTRPVYLLDRPMALRLVIVGLVPGIFGLICGFTLGHSKPLYIALQILAAIGGYVGGWEHRSGREAAVRGFLGGAVFGGAILLMHELTGDTPTVKLPEPAVILMVFTAGIGAILAAFGAAARATREEKGPAEPFKLDFSLWLPGEYYGFAGSAVLLLSMFLPWYGTSTNPNAEINGARGTFSAFGTFKVLDILLVGACLAPFILAWIVARGHALTWKPGEVTMIVGMTAFVLIVLNGIILGKPGGPDSEIELKIGWYIGLLGSAGICAAGVLRQAEQARERKPPGVL